MAAALVPGQAEHLIDAMCVAVEWLGSRWQRGLAWALIFGLFLGLPGLLLGPFLGAMAGDLTGKLFGGLFKSDGKQANDLRDRVISAAGGLMLISAIFIVTFIRSINK